jgi:hypothetical protein
VVKRQRRPKTTTRQKKAVDPRKKGKKRVPSEHDANSALREYESTLTSIKGFVSAAVIKKKNVWAIELAVQDLKDIPGDFPLFYCHGLIQLLRQKSGCIESKGHRSSCCTMANSDQQQAAKVSGSRTRQPI